MNTYEFPVSNQALIWYPTMTKTWMSFYKAKHDVIRKKPHFL